MDNLPRGGKFVNTALCVFTSPALHQMNTYNNVSNEHIYIYIYIYIYMLLLILTSFALVRTTPVVSSIVK